jgi:hypothetical protein
MHYIDECLIFVGVIGLVWYAAWLIVVREGPELDRHISPEELQYIQESLGTQSVKVSFEFVILKHYSLFFLLL